MPVNSKSLQFDSPVILLGGAEVSTEQLFQVLARTYPLVAADGGANHLLGTEVIPDAIVGDLDSLTHQANWQKRTKLLSITEQDSTDFEKCLYSVQAPWYLALGFCGQRLDHTLASLHVLMQRLHSQHVLLLSEDDVIVLCDCSVSIQLDVASRLSIFPLTPVKFASSRGLLYPLDALHMQIGSSIGTSNSVTTGDVHIQLNNDSSGCYALIAARDQLPAFEDLIKARANAAAGE